YVFFFMYTLLPRTPRSSSSAASGGYKRQEKDRAAAFIDYSVSSEGASVLARYGFIPSGRQTGYDY
ncbi:hypothetical protein, partial [Methanoregula sp.]|uniref:hypothetical protein n=1 Tax=Methanoregula sp. TaxID=2052170 RepID=UPI0025E63743